MQPAEPPNIGMPRTVAWGLMGLALFIASGLYLAGLHGDFFYDDLPNLIFNRHIQIDHVSLDTLAASLANGASSPFGRPVSMLSFALNHGLSGGFDPAAFKAVNLAIHLANGLLLFLLVDLLASQTMRRDSARWLALWLAAAWLLHPIHVSAVLHVTQRMTLLATLFSLAGLVLYLWGRLGGPTAKRRAAIVAACLLFWPAAFLSKETGLIWPLYVVAIEWLLLSRAKPSAYRVAGGLVALFALCTAAALAYLGVSWLEQGYQMRGFSLLERLLTEARALWFYARLIVLPYLPDFGLYHDDFGLSRGLFEPPSTFAALAGLAALSFLVMKYRQVAPLASLGVVWFLVGHSMESTILPLILVQEHRNYLPAVGLLLVCAEAGRMLSGRLAGRISSHMLAALAIVPLIWLAAQTGLRAHQYGDEIRRTQMEAAYHPLSPRAHEDAGRVFADLGRRHGITDALMLSMAVEHYAQAAQLDPGAKQSLVSMLGIACALKQAPTPELLGELARRMRESRFQPGDNMVIVNFTRMEREHAKCLSLSQTSAIYAAMLANPSMQPPDRGSVRLAWANRLLSLPGNEHRAASLLDAAVADAPGAAVIRLRYASVLASLGEFDKARLELQMARSLKTLSAAEFEQLGGKLLEDQLDTATGRK